MKKILFVLIALIGFTVAKAQFATQLPLTAGDTTTNTGTASKIIKATGAYSGVAIQVKVAKISGTAGGTVKIQGSLDGSNYEDIGSSYTVTDVSSQTKTFYISAPLPPYIKVLETGTGTMSAVFTVYYVFRKY